ESEYRLKPSEVTRLQFTSGYEDFTNIFANIDGTPEMKSQLDFEVSDYAKSFSDWIKVSDRIHTLSVLIDLDSQDMLPRADAIIELANASARNAAAALAASQKHTRFGILAVGIGMVAF